MSSVREILGNIRERVSNPFVFSFIVSWLLINWRVSISLIWYDVEQIRAEGFKSIYGLIDNELNLIDILVLPFAFALLYTFGMPPFRVLIDAFNSKISKWGEEWNIKILQSGKIPIDRYLNMRNNYTELNKSLEKIIDEESIYINKLGEANILIQSLQNKIKIIQENLDIANVDLKLINNINHLNGKWKIKSGPFDSQDLDDKLEIVEIYNGRASYILNDTIYEAFTITDFHFFKSTRFIFFKRVIRKDYFISEYHQNISLKNILTINTDGTLKGFEENIPITYNIIDITTHVE